MATPNSVARFLASDTGRWLRVGAGLGLLTTGLRRGGAGGALTAVIALVPLAAGTFDYCVISFLLGGPLRGEEIREG